MCCRLPSTWPFPRCPEATPASHSPAPDLACLNSKAKRAKSISSGVLSKHASRIQWQISGKHRRKPWTDSLWKSFSPLSARSFSISNVSVVEGQWQRLGHCNWELKSSGGCGAAWSPGITLPAQHGRSHIAPLPGAALFPAGKHLPNSNGRQTNSKQVQQETCKQCFSKKKSAFYEVHHYISLLALKSRRQTQFLFRIWFWSVCIKMEKYSLWEKAPLTPFWLEIHTNEQWHHVCCHLLHCPGKAVDILRCSHIRQNGTNLHNDATLRKICAKSPWPSFCAHICCWWKEKSPLPVPQLHSALGQVARDIKSFWLSERPQEGWQSTTSSGLGLPSYTGDRGSMSDCWGIQAPREALLRQPFFLTSQTAKDFAWMTREITDGRTVEGLTVFMAPSEKLQVICVVVVIPWRSQHLKG